jgi:probable lipoprotein NlpC
MTIKSPIRQTWMTVLLLGLLALLAGCQSPASREPAVHGRLGNPNEVRSALIEQYQEWQGVPYRLGGQSRRGVDCSGFVQLTFRERFGLELPRDTQQQAHIGAQVSTQGLQPGDLLFFNTGHWSKHVGIFIRDGQFLHASTSKGVIISDLDSPYWRKNYWQSRRLTD